MVHSSGGSSSEMEHQFKKSTLPVPDLKKMAHVYPTPSASISAIAGPSSNKTIVSILLQYMPANTSMQGTYIPQYTQVPGNNISVEVFALTKSLKQNSCCCCCFWQFSFFQDNGAQQPVAIETPTEHTSYSYQHNKWRVGSGGWSSSLFVHACLCSGEVREH